MTDNIPKELQVRIDEGIALERKFTDQMRAAKDLEGQLKDFWKSIESEMIKKSIKSVKGDFGSLTIAEKTTYKAPDIEKVAPRFLKKSLDTGRIKAEFTLKNKLPAGIEFVTTNYLMKRFKTIE